MLFNLLGCKDENTTNTKPSTTNVPLIESLSLIDSQGYTQKVTLSNHRLTLHNSYQPIIIVNIFNTLSIETQYQLKILSALQMEFQEDIFVLSLFTGDSPTKKNLHSFLSKNDIGHFVALEQKKQPFQTILYKSLAFNTLALPVSIIYTNSHYVARYTGAIPIEMMRYVILEEIKKLKVK